MVYPKGIPFSAKHKEKIRKAVSRFWKNNPERRKLAAEKRNRVIRTKKFRKMMSLLKKKQFLKNPEIAQKISKGKKQAFRKNPELRKKIDKIMTAWWKSHPQAKKSLSKKMKLFYLTHPLALKEFLKHGKNPLKPHLKTKQGFIVRSKGEKEIANFLHEHKIPSLYEAISLFITKKPYAGNICTPDFYIPSWNIFIEFYGGFPKAWKKKVLKNKLYPAHKIPVLAITPAELENLDYYLVRQGEELSRGRMARGFKVRAWLRD